ncbi:MAG TPA: cupin domain-containing protein [Anaerolineales bacterium]|nr:cupin domain-containing protein [Anaerolineales bacterium]
MTKAPLVTPWADPAAPTQSTLWRLMTGEELRPYSWSNGPFDVYSAHSHSYNKVIYVVQGSITFGLPELGKQLTLKAGDRLDLPAGVVHDAHVGGQGVICLEAHKD